MFNVIPQRQRATHTASVCWHAAMRQPALKNAPPTIYFILSNISNSKCKSQRFALPSEKHLELLEVAVALIRISETVINDADLLNEWV